MKTQYFLSDSYLVVNAFYPPRSVPKLCAPLAARCMLKCVPKKVDWAKYLDRHSSKNIWVIKLSFCQNDSPIGGSFWQKDSFITYILFELWLITLLWIVLVFLTQTLFEKKPFQFWRKIWICVLVILLQL